MKFCPSCKATYPDDANFCPQERCATPTGPQRLQAVAAAPPSAAAAPVADGRGRFQLGPRLGGGSTGEVYRATDSQTGAQVAYKIVSSDVLPNPAALARAERELKQLMRVQSPRIATLIDCGKTADERLYIALELVEGDSLDRALRGSAMGLAQAKQIIAQVGQALLEAQKAGIVHRDVAPKNILIGPTGDVKVINFAIAKPLNDRAAGVAAYLSPEQVQGKPVDQRSNTYSLACVFYHLITGEPPFQGPPETVLELHVSSPPLAPSQRRPEAALTPEVDRVVLKALDKSSSRRHLTLRLFLSEVEALVAPSSAPAGAPASSKEAGAGFAKTMLFAGGQAEVANLVAKAIASRTNSPAAGVPILAAPAVAPAAAAAPPPRSMSPVGTAVTLASPGTADSPRLAASSSNGSGGHHETPSAAPPSSPVSVQPLHPVRVNDPREVDNRAARLTPPPVTPYPPSVAASTPAAAPPPVVTAASPPPSEASTAPTAPLAATAALPQQPRAATPAGAAAADPGKAGKGGAAFRETLWFKKGDVEHMIAEARAKMASQGAKPADADVVPGEEVKPIEDRYRDDGTLTADDRKKFSLRTGGTATALPAVKAGSVPGEAMTEHDVIREVSGSRRGLVIAVAAIIVVAVVAAVVMLMRGKPPLPPPAAAPAAGLIPAPPPPAAAAAKPGPAARKPDAPTRAARRDTKVVVAPQGGKRSDPDKRARRKGPVKKRK